MGSKNGFDISLAQAAELIPRKYPLVDTRLKMMSEIQ